MTASTLAGAGTRFGKCRPAATCLCDRPIAWQYDDAPTCCAKCGHDVAGALVAFLASRPELAGDEAS